MTSSMTGNKRSTNPRQATSLRLACPRCGIRRLVKNTSEESKKLLCRDCKSVDPGWPESVRMLA